MHPRQVLPAAAVQLAAEQQGVLSTAQLRHFGISEMAQRRLARDWTKVGHGLYSLTEPTWLTGVSLGLLTCGADGAVTGLAAARLHGLLGRDPRTITISHHRDHALLNRHLGDWTIAFRRLNRTGRGAPSRAGVEDCLVDVAAEADELSVAGAVTRALGQRLTTPDRLAARFAQESRLRHRHLLQRLCSPGEAGHESALEWLYTTRVERAHRLPPRQRQVSLSSRTRSDGWYPEHGLIIELDGQTHDDRAKDRWRDNLHALHRDATTLRYGWADVTLRGCAVARQVAEALAARGWAGTPAACSRCRARGNATAVANRW
ncbi:hypothetical protein ACPCG0_10680 [Propionibacteriaceae bacterium Y1923]